MCVAVDETGDDAAALEVDASRVGNSQTHDVLLGPDCNKTVATDGDRLRLRVLPVECRDPTVEENEIGSAVLGLSRCATKASGKCTEPGQHNTAIWVDMHDQISLPD